MNNKVIIIGAGAIAHHLGVRLELKGIKVHFHTRKSQLECSLETLLLEEGPKAVFLAISTLDKGEAAKDYMLTCIHAGIPVVTCEKGALAYHAKVLWPYFETIGFSATVGGGTRMLKYVRSRHLEGKHVEIQAVLNGTLNFIFDEIRRGRSLGEACNEARRSGYSEPGAADPLSLINGELKDVSMKTCVFFNTVLATNRLVRPDDFGLLEFKPEDLERLNEEGAEHRLVVSFYNHSRVRQPLHLGKEFGLHYVDGWHITGSFRQITQSSKLAQWLPCGVGNAVHIIEGELGVGGEYTLSGPGAGHEPTTSAMLADFEELCQ